MTVIQQAKLKRKKKKGKKKKNLHNLDIYLILLFISYFYFCAINHQAQNTFAFKATGGVGEDKLEAAVVLALSKAAPEASGETSLLTFFSQKQFGGQGVGFCVRWLLF